MMTMSGIPPHKKRPAKDRGPLAREAAPVPPRRRALVWTLSGAAHLAVIGSLFFVVAAQPQEPQAIPITMVQMPEEPTPGPVGPPGPPGPVGPPEAPKAAVAEIPKPVIPVPQPIVRPTPPVRSASIAKEDAEPAPVDTFADVLSTSQLAGAASAESEGNGSGGGGGGGGGCCDTARIVQQALRKDPLVRTAVRDANRLGKAVMLWNGDWVRSGVQEGKGLSAVREAIVWELAFSPPACREKRVKGPVLLSLADGAARFLIGSNDWRWSDLLELR